MPWHKITLPLTMEIDPEVVRIGELAWDCFLKENRPDGFGMFHATRGSKGELDDKRLVYLTPVASELCREIAENYTLEPCETPARDEPNMAWVFGDPRAMGLLKEYFEPEPDSWEWQVAQETAAAEAQAAAEAEAAIAAQAAAEAEAQAATETARAD